MKKYLPNIESNNPAIWVIPFDYISPHTAYINSPFLDWLADVLSEDVYQISSHTILLFNTTEEYATEFATLMKLTWFE